MTRTISISAHDLDPAAWKTLTEDVQAAVAKAKEAPGGSGITGSIYDSHPPEGTPHNRAL